MAEDIPAPLTYGTVVGTFMSLRADSSDEGDLPELAPMTGEVRIRPNGVDFIRITGAGILAVAQEIVCKIVDGALLAPDGTTTLRLLATDSPGVNPTPFQYTAIFAINGAATQPPSIVFDLPTDTTVDIGAIVGGTAAQPVLTVYVNEPPKTAYDIAVDNGFEGTEAEWLATLQGEPGDPGDPGDPGPAGPGVPEGGSAGQVLAKASATDHDTHWVDPPTGGGGDGQDGASAYEVAVANGFVGTEQEWLDSLKGDPGDPGATGASAYEVAVAQGFVGDEAAWLASLEGTDGENGDPGSDGASAYQVWLSLGNAGTEQDFIDSLQGPPGDPGQDASDFFQVVTQSEYASLAPGTPGVLYVVTSDA